MNRKISVMSFFICWLCIITRLTGFSQITSLMQEIPWHNNWHRGIDNIKEIKIKEYNLLNNSDTLGKVITKFIFDSNGNKIGATIYFSDSIQEKTIYSYNTIGQLKDVNRIRIVENKDSTSRLHVNNIKYNKEGKIIYFEEKYSDQKFYLIIRASYNKIGFPTKIKLVVYESSTQQKMGSDYSGQMLYYYYTDQEPAMKRSSDKMIIKKDFCKLDEYKHIIKRTVLDKKTSFTIDYLYDNNGLLLESITNDEFNNGKTRCTFTYIYY
jgi:hypothetical protein